MRYLPLHPGTNELIHDYLEAAGHGDDDNGALFRPIKNNRAGRLEKAVTPDAVYKLVRQYSALLGFEIGAHALRATAATNALDHKHTFSLFSPDCLLLTELGKSANRPLSSMTLPVGL
jgi:integrase